MLGRLISALILASMCLGLLFAASGTAADDRGGRRNDDDGAPTAVSSSADQRTALVIGNGAYQSSPLRNPPNDARAVSKALRELGFNVIEKTNVNQKDMLETIFTFGEHIRAGGIGLFYYAGHGVQVNGKNYLIPVGARIETERQVEVEAVDVGRVLGVMDAARNRINIVILDACRDNPFSRSFRTVSQGLAMVDAPTGTFIAYATSPGKTATEGTGDNGLYTSKLIQAIREPGLRIEDVFSHVRTAVRMESGGRQVPWESSSLEGAPFYFKAPSGEGSFQVAGGPGPAYAPPKPEMPKVGSVKVKSTPSGAMVYVDGVQKGYAPLTISGQPPGSVRLRVVLPGYESVNETVEIQAAKEETMNYTLAPVTAPPKPTPEPVPFSQPSTNSGTKVSKDGTITDLLTLLMWAPAPDRDVNWNQAYDYARNLRLGGYSDWRLPSRAELKELYRSGQYRALGVTGLLAWSSEVEEGPSAWNPYILYALDHLGLRSGSSAWLCDFNDGIEQLVTRRVSHDNRVLAVRIRM